MTFNSVQYAAIFLPVVVLTYWRLGRRNQNLLLLAASYLFYGAWDYRFLSLIVASTIVDYSLARLLDATADQRRRNVLLGASVTVNLGILGVFKYFDFFADSLTAMLEGAGLGIAAPSVDILLPVGISFYTFQTISYTFDVYRGTISSERNLLNVAVYVAFFPQLVAGPIERASHLMPQISQSRTRPDRARVESAIALIVLGLVKKVAIADALAPTVNAAFDDPNTASSLALAVGIVAFALQIYADFSAYSDIARGSSRLLGIELLENFNQPYLSRNIQVFWNTWHISLSNWLKDYLYIPLGGNRRSPRRTSINLAIVMLLGGLWHGSSWNFVIWGALHGLFLGIHRTLRQPSRVRATDVPTPRDVPAMFVTFTAVCFAWIFFRAETLGGALDYLGGLFRLSGGSLAELQPKVFALAGLVLLLDLGQRRARDHTFMLRWRAEAQGLALGAAAVALIVFSGSAPVEFIYFQF